MHVRASADAAVAVSIGRCVVFFRVACRSTGDIMSPVKRVLSTLLYGSRLPDATVL